MYSVVNGRLVVVNWHRAYGTTLHPVLKLLMVLSDFTKLFNLSLTMSPENHVN